MDHQHWQARELSGGNAGDGIFWVWGGIPFRWGESLGCFWLENGWKWWILYLSVIFLTHDSGNHRSGEKFGHPLATTFENGPNARDFLLQARREDEQIYKLKGFPIGDFHSKDDTRDHRGQPIIHHVKDFPAAKVTSDNFTFRHQCLYQFWPTRHLLKFEDVILIGTSVLRQAILARSW